MASTFLATSLESTICETLRKYFTIDREYSRRWCENVLNLKPSVQYKEHTLGEINSGSAFKAAWFGVYFMLIKLYISEVGVLQCSEAPRQRYFGSVFKNVGSCDSCFMSLSFICVIFLKYSFFISLLHYVVTDSIKLFTTFWNFIYLIEFSYCIDLDTVFPWTHYLMT